MRAWVKQVRTMQLMSVIMKRNFGVRVRFAPSPTGYLHLGGLRTALYNHLFAMSNKGITILRIEDTDQQRKVEGAVEKLVDDLSWCGLHYDEGPVFQSDRRHIYRKYVDYLIEAGHAYRCFCSSSRMDILRREAIKVGQVPKYDNRCRMLSESEVTNKIQENVPYCVRFKLTPCGEPFEDMVYGFIAQDVASIEGDPIILKSDGFPTYHLANVVDDHEMNISHVLRGVEWQGSTKKHILMYKAFGWKPPHFAHLPLLLNPDGSKLSKRQGDVHVQHYKEKGIFPEALLNMVVRAGGGFDIEHWQRDVESFTLHQLAEKFDLRKINGSSCKVGLDKLDLCNRLELQRRIRNPPSLALLVQEIQELVKKTFADSEHRDLINISDNHIMNILHWTQNRIYYPTDLLLKDWKFLWVLPKSVELSNEEILALQNLSEQLKRCEFKRDTLIESCKKCAIESQVKFASLMKMLRRVLSGLQEGPAVVEMMEILGKETVLHRLQEAKQWKTLR